MARFVVLSLVVVMFLGSGSALNCYKCSGDQCRKSSDSWNTQTCGMTQTSQSYVSVCSKQTWVDSSNKEQIERGCIYTEMVNNVPLAKCPSKPGSGMVCLVCTGDLCNSAPSLHSKFALVACVVAFLIPKYYF